MSSTKKALMLVFIIAAIVILILIVLMNGSNQEANQSQSLTKEVVETPEIVNIPPNKWMYISQDKLSEYEANAANGSRDYLERLAGVYQYGITVPQNLVKAEVLYSEAKLSYEVNDPKNMYYEYLLLNRWNMLQYPFFKNDSLLRDEFQEYLGTQLSDASGECGTPSGTDKDQVVIGCILKRTIHLNVGMVEWALNQGADFKDSRLEEQISQTIYSGSISSTDDYSGRDVWIKMIENGLNPNIEFKTTSDNPVTLFEESISCNQNLADFRLAFLLLEKGADVNAGQQGPIMKVIERCPELPLAKAFVSSAISKGVDLNKKVRDYSREKLTTLPDAAATAGASEVLALLIKSGGTVDENILNNTNKKIADLQAQITSGDVRAILALGEIYNSGDGVTRNQVKAEEYFKLAAEKGNTKAEWYLSHSERLSADVRWNYLNQSAAKGFSIAQFDLGVYYQEQGNIEKAKYWYLKADAQGYGYATDALNRMYIKQDIAKIKSDMLYVEDLRASWRL